MRYIIIPLGIVLLSMWTAYSVTDIIYSIKYNKEFDFATDIWIGFFIVEVVFLSVIYW